MDRPAALMPLLLLMSFAIGCGSAKVPNRVPDGPEAAKEKPSAAKSKPDGAEPAKKEPSAAKSKPDRPPEFFGVVEKVTMSSFGNRPEFESVLIKLHPKVDGKSKPSSPPDPEFLWLNLPKTTVDRRSGSIAVGQFAWVWHKGEFYDTHPLTIYPEYIVTESVAAK